MNKEMWHGVLNEIRDIKLTMKHRPKTTQVFVAY